MGPVMGFIMIIKGLFSLKVSVSKTKFFLETEETTPVLFFEKKQKIKKNIKNISIILNKNIEMFFLCQGKKISLKGKISSLEKEQTWPGYEDLSSCFEIQIQGSLQVRGVVDLSSCIYIDDESMVSLTPSLKISFPEYLALQELSKSGKKKEICNFLLS
jgi:hypothetical protein